jgi:aspartyl/glutamyl-tRNA(Asn/Gln) amidotransferase C subunit
MQFTEQDLDNLSKLARITISKEEKPKMLLDIQSILGYVSEINKVSSSSSLTDKQGDVVRGEESFFNVVREDVITRESGSHTKRILAEAPEVKGDYVKVKQVLK